MTSHRVLLGTIVSSFLLTVALACTGPNDASRDGGADGSTNEASREGGLPDGDDGTPSLTALVVSPLTLSPPFSPGIHDYSVRCVAGDNALRVSMTAAPGSESTLTLPTRSATSPMQTVAVTATENQAVVASATRGEASVEYWVRCLPHDFPSYEWTPHADAGAPPPGYYLIGTDSPRSDNGSYAVVLDGRGVPVWYSRVAAEPGAGVVDVDSLVPGEVSFFPRIDDPAMAKFGVDMLRPFSTKKVGATGMVTDQHELRVLSNGDYLTISTPQESIDLTGMMLQLFDGGVTTLSGLQPTVACNLVEFAPDGTPVWTWSADDHFDVVKASVFPIPYAVGGDVIDAYHCNSIDVDPANGNLLVSARQLGSVFYIEKSTGHVLWRMGGGPSNKDRAPYVSVADPFSGQHDARFQPGWSTTTTGGHGKISLFDDQTYGSGVARGVVYDVAVEAPAAGGDAGEGDGATGDDGSAGTATVSWQYKGLIPSSGAGSFRITADGSRVVGWGINGSTPRIAFSEVDDAGRDLLDFYFLYGDTTYRAVKVPATQFDLDVLRHTAGVSP